MSKQFLVRPHPPDADGCVLEITPQSAGWQRVGFQVNRLAAGQSVGSDGMGRES